MKEPITVEAIFQKATTTIDGGWRISFDLSHADSQKISEIAQLANETLNLVIMTTDYIEELNKDIKPDVRKKTRHVK